MTHSPLRRMLTAASGVTAAAVVVLGGLAASPASADTGRILSVPGAKAIPGSFIVVLRDDVTPRSATRQTAAQMTQHYGGSVRSTWTAALHGFAARMSEAQALKLSADPRVSYVQADAEVHALDVQPNPPSWGLDRVDQRNLPLDSSYTYNTTASNVHAYIIDTGIRTTHQTFGGRATWGTNTVDTNNTDCAGHGTHVAGTVGGSQYGVAKGVQLVAVKVLDCLGNGSASSVLGGLNWVVTNAIKPAVANMSLGAGANSAIDSAVANAIASGVTFAVASGNDNTDACNTSPARVASAITVNATTSTDARASFSNFGSCTDIFAPGESITSSWNTSDSATNTISGTSMATPHVAGAAALWLATHPTDSPAQVATGLTNAATTGVVTNPGTGSPNRLLYTQSGGGGCASPGQKIANPGFESGPTSWTTTSGVIGQWGGQGQPTHSGTWNAWLDGYGSTHTDTVSQTVTLPAGCTGYTLSFWLHIDTAETTTTTAYDKLTVQVGSTTLATYSNLNKATGYTQKSFNLGGFAGQTVTLKFTGTEDSSLQTSFVIDDTDLSVS